MKYLTQIAFILLVIPAGCRSQKESTTLSDNRPPMSQRMDPPDAAEVFKMDVNNDGKLSSSELDGPLLRDFAKIDKDGDGFITREEFINAPKPPRGQGPLKKNR